MLLGEEAVVGNVSSTSTDDGYFLYNANAFSTRHTEGTTVSFVDGHSKWYRPDQIAANAFQTGGVKMGTTVSFVDGHSKWYRPDQIAANAFQTGGVKMAQCP
jgi:prepilin-type processing-associated H-X9-DG protein